MQMDLVQCLRDQYGCSLTYTLLFPMTDYSRTSQTRLKRLPKRGHHDQETIHAILDEAMVCHLGFVLDEQPCVIPTLLIREANSVFIHGSRVSRMLKHLASGASACLTVTLLDGLVLARSGFHHSANYRSVVIYGNGVAVDGDRKREILDRFVESLVPGRLEDIRTATRKEINATTVIEFPLDEVSAKIRSGPPVDDDEDYDLPVWAGELPMELRPGPPIADPLLRGDPAVPEYLLNYQRSPKG